MCDGEKVRHAWIYGGMCEIRPPVYILYIKRSDKETETQPTAGAHNVS